MAQITTIHNLSALTTGEINANAEFMVNNDPTAVVRANKVTLSQIKADRANVDLTNLTNAGNIVAAKASLPSTVYDDLNLGASDAEYIAPSDGYYYFNKGSGTANAYAFIHNKSNGMFVYIQTVSAGSSCILNIPVLKGHTVAVSYSASGTTNAFRFIYAEGSKSEHS